MSGTLEMLPDVVVEITDQQFYTALRVARIIVSRDGKPITSRQIIAILEVYHDTSIEGPELRKLIHFIRINQFCVNLIAGSEGYHIEKDKRKVKEYVKALKGRASLILQVADSFKI